MMRKINFFLVLFVLTFYLTCCQSVRENLSMKKKSNSDEFLIKKKNPLVLPPEFSKLPTPDEENAVEKKAEDEKLDLSKILNKQNNQNKQKEINSNKKLEKSISELLNKK